MEESHNIYSINLIVQNQNYESISAQVICPICNQLKFDAKITNCPGNCQLSVCDECSKKINKCPLCRTSPNWNDYLAIDHLLSTLDFQCEKCKAIFHFDDFKDHYATHETAILNDVNIPPNSDERIINEVIEVRQPPVDNDPSKKEKKCSEKMNVLNYLKGKVSGK